MPEHSGTARGRVLWLDYARMLAIICVVITHTTQRVYKMDAQILAQSPAHGRLFALSMFTIGRLGVPIFFFLTGYLLLDRDYPREKYIAFLKKNFCGLLLTTAAWTVLYSLFRTWFYDTPFHVGNCLKTLLFIKSSEMSHMWYMPVILGLYLFLPLVANGLKHTDLDVLYIPLAIAFAYQFVIPVINVFLTANGLETFASLPDVSFAGNKYGLLILMGYLVKKGAFQRIPSPVLAALGLAGFVFTVFSQNYSYMRGVTYNVWYNSASLIVADLAIFLLLSRARFQSGRLAGSIAAASFGIYLVHSPINLILIRYYQPGVSGWERLTVVFFLTFALSWALVALLGKIEPVARVLLFQKKQKR